MDTDSSPLRINERLDIDALAAEYRRRERLQVRQVLGESAAERLYRELTGQKLWNLVYRVAGKHVDNNAAAVARWPRQQRRKLEKFIHAEATGGFQYFYASVPVYDIFHGNKLPGHFFNTLFEFLNGDDFLGLARRVTGDESIAFADVQATRYDAGHFLTCHDDEVSGKNRRVAYVLGMTPVWRPDWGGALSFVRDDGNIDEAYMPAFNVLNLFRVPSRHLVGVVAPFAGASRYSITGWLRSGEDPGC